MTLESDLRALAGGLPEPPDLRSRVLHAMGEASARRRRRRVVVLAFAVFLLAPATALAVSPGLRDRVLDAYPDNVDAAVVANWQLLASIEALAAADKIGANYHFAWFQALNRVP